MKKVLLLLSALTGLTFNAQNSAPTAQWIRSNNGQKGNNESVIKSVKDANGNYFVLSGDNADVFISKFDNSGSLLASYTYNDPTNGTNSGSDLEVDLQGNIYHCGKTFVVTQWQTYPLIVKMSPTGTVLWETKPPCQYYLNNANFGMAVDMANGNVFYCGANSDTFSVGKLNSSGTILWNKNISLTGYGDGEAHDIVIDQYGNAYVTGKMQNTSTNDYDFVTIKLDPSGNILWYKTLNGLANADDDGTLIRIDNSANTFVAGTLADSSSSNTSTFLVKYNASGGQQWMKKFHKSGQVYSVAGDVQLDASGTSYIGVNYMQNWFTGSSEVFRYTSSGTLVYNTPYSDVAYTLASINSIKTDALGNCYIGGDKFSSGNNFDMYIAKINLSGILQWDVEYNSGTVGDYAKTIHLDNGNNIIISGTSSGGGSNSDAALIKYTSTGTFVWQSFYSGLGNPQDDNKEVITQGNYSIYTIGTVQNDFSNYDMLISKYDNQGNILWQNVQDYGAQDNFAEDMINDANYNISVLGSMTYNQSVLTKYDSIGTPLFTTTLQNGVMYKKVILDNSGNHLFAGNAQSNSAVFVVGKTNASGTITFENLPTTNTGYNTSLGGLETDASGRFYAAGTLDKDPNTSGHYRKFLVQRFSPSGNLLWSKTLGGLDSVEVSGYDMFYWSVKKVVLDPSANNLFMLATARTNGNTNIGALLVKFDANGNELWRVMLNNADQIAESAVDMASSSSNSIVVLTSTSNNGQHAKLYRIDKSTGGLVTPAQDVYAPYNSSIFPNALKEQNGTGNIYIAGRTAQGYLVYMGVIKLNSAFQTLWGSLTPGVLIGENQAYSMDVSGNDRIYVAGSMSMSNGSSGDAALLKLCDINPESISASGQLENICPGNTVTLSAGSSNAYNWNADGSNQQTYAADSTGYYFCTTYKQDGCWKNTDTLYVSIKNPPSAPSVCVVTVDTASDYNIIYWDPTSISGADSIRVYREDVTNVYSYIGSVSADSNGVYNDTVADPNVTTKRYKISAIDSCGNESALSSYHNTIYIVDNGGGQYSWNPLYTIENSANPVNNYVLMRDDFSNGNWQQVSITAGTQNTIVDPNYASYPNARWRVETVWNISCDPDRAIVNTSRSNIKNQLAGPTTGVDEQSLTSVSFSPNPFNQFTQIDLGSRNGKINCVFELFDETGRLVRSENINTQKFMLNRGDLANGIYFYRIADKTAGNSLKGKLVINQ